MNKEYLITKKSSFDMGELTNILKGYEWRSIKRIDNGGERYIERVYRNGSIEIRSVHREAEYPNSAVLILGGKQETIEALERSLTANKFTLGDI